MKLANWDIRLAKNPKICDMCTKRKRKCVRVGSSCVRCIEYGHECITTTASSSQAAPKDLSNQEDSRELIETNEPVVSQHQNEEGSASQYPESKRKRSTDSMEENDAAGQRKQLKRNINVTSSEKGEAGRVNSPAYEIEIMQSTSPAAQSAIGATSVFVANRQAPFVRRCKICRQPGHNSRSCPRKPKAGR